MKKILFLGYNSKQTCLIDFLRTKKNIITQTDERLYNLAEYDLTISFGYRHILSKEMIATSKRPIINLHISYLPYNRGAHPNFWSFAENTPKGVTIHEIDEGIDTGPIICQKIVNFREEENTFSKTYKKLNREIELLFIQKYHLLISGKYSTKPQASKGTYHSFHDLPSIKSWDVKIKEYFK